MYLEMKCQKKEVLSWTHLVPETEIQHKSCDNLTLPFNDCNHTNPFLQSSHLQQLWVAQSSVAQSSIKRWKQQEVTASPEIIIDDNSLSSFIKSGQHFFIKWKKNNTESFSS